MKREKNISEEERMLDEEKIISLQAMIANAEQTILSAKQMLAKINGQKGKEKLNSLRQQNQRENETGKVVYGNFDGQIMLGEDGKQYPVPSNYSSKSKLVEGDVMKLTITPEGSFIYKQVGPVERKYLIGIAENNDRGTLVVNVDGKRYRVLLAAATYFKIEPGDEVTLVVPRDRPSEWGAIENVLRKADDQILKDRFPFQDPEKYSQLERAKRAEKRNYQVSDLATEEDIEEEEATKPSAIEKLAQEMEMERKKRTFGEDLLDEWTPNIEEIRQEIGQQEVKQPAEVAGEE